MKACSLVKILLFSSLAYSPVKTIHATATSFISFYRLMRTMVLLVQPDYGSQRTIGSTIRQLGTSK